MKKSTDVFLFGRSVERRRPRIDFEIPQNGAGFDWLRVGDVIEDERPLEDYVAPRLVVPRPDALDWHFYSDMCSGGMLSERAANLLRPYLDQYFMLLPASINDAPYFMLKSIDSLDCLDRERSDLVYFNDNDPGRVMRVRKYVFHLNRIPDPLIFAIPEFPKRAFCTQTVRRIVTESGLKGFDFTPTRELNI